jgi:hypothetical protein
MGTARSTPCGPLQRICFAETGRQLFETMAKLQNLKADLLMDGGEFGGT